MKNNNRRGPVPKNDQNFSCQNCGAEIASSPSIGTKNRNHCPKCLYSVHLDSTQAGDRESLCQGLMRPIGLCFKKAKPKKYSRESAENETADPKTGAESKGELMLIHECVKCGKISINRLAADDDSQKVLRIFKDSLQLPAGQKEKLTREGIFPLTETDEAEIRRQLFGF